MRLSSCARYEFTHNKTHTCIVDEEVGDVGEAGEHGGGVGVESPGKPEAWRACRSPRDSLTTLAPVKKSLMKLSGERNPATLREVLAGVDEEGPIRN